MMLCLQTDISDAGGQNSVHTKLKSTFFAPTDCLTPGFTLTCSRGAFERPGVHDQGQRCACVRERRSKGEDQEAHEHLQLKHEHEDYLVFMVLSNRKLQAAGRGSPQLTSLLCHVIGGGEKEARLKEK